MAGSLVERTAQAFGERFGIAPQRLFLAPGRINLIGEHLDYNDGLVLPAAIDRYICFAVGPGGDADRCEMVAIDRDEQMETSASGDWQPAPGHWSTFLLGILHGLRERGHAVRGFRAAFASTIPMGAGLSSSAALCCGFAFALNRQFNLGLSRKDIALIAQQAEHAFAGVRCGIMDQYASVFGEADKVIKLDCGKLEHELVEARLGMHVLVLFDSHVKHVHSASGYNDRRREVEVALHMIQRAEPEVRTYRDCTLHMVERMRAELGPVGYKRAAYVVGEMKRVEEAAQALAAGDIPRLGRLLHRTHQGLSTEYEVSCAELDHVVAETMKQDGATGARMMGGGFGGCSINLIERNAVDRVTESVAARFRERFGVDMDVYPVRIVRGVHECTGE